MPILPIGAFLSESLSSFLPPLVNLVAPLSWLPSMNFQQCLCDISEKLDSTEFRNGIIVLASNTFLLTSTTYPATKAIIPAPEDVPSQELLERSHIKSLTVCSIVVPLNFLLREAYRWPYAEIAAFDLFPFLTDAFLRHAKRGWRFIRDLWTEPSQTQQEGVSHLHRNPALQRYHRRCTFIGVGFMLSSCVTCGLTPAHNIPTWKVSLFYAAAKLVVDGALEYHACRTLRSDGYSQLSGSDSNGNWPEPNPV